MIVVVPKKNGKLKFCVDLKQLSRATKKDPYPLPFFDEVLNIVARYEVYSFSNGYLRYHQIFIAFKDKYKIIFVTDWGVFVWMAMLIWCKKWATNLLENS